jgi:hypothetical protein
MSGPAQHQTGIITESIRGIVDRVITYHNRDNGWSVLRVLPFNNPLLAVFVGTRKALAMAVKNQDTSHRQTALRELLVG